MATQPGMHPSADALNGFASGKLEDRAAAAIMDHLDGCPDCCRTVAALPGDDFLDRLRQAQGPDGPPTVTDPVPSPGSAPNTRPAASSSANLPPEFADNPQYEVLRELGRGGMGVVYLAKNKLMDRLEVLKVVNKGLLDYPGTMERFLREIRSAARLNHANIVAAYSAVQSGESLAFAMEYVEGEDLAHLVQTRGPLPVVHACDYIQQAAVGLQHAFEKKMVHRDIKPENLILARDGQRHILKVLDFGLAKVTRARDEDTGLTRDGVILGTPDYVAPEQTLDAANADIRADIYSLGCTLYYLLTGAPPFKGRGLYEVLEAHQSMVATPLDRVRPEVPEELAAVVGKMMAKDPARRYQTPVALAQALAAFVKPGADGETAIECSSGARTDFGRRPPVGKPWSKRTWLIAGAIAGGVLQIGLLGLWAGGVFRVKTPEGTLVVEVNVPNPDVYVDGRKMKVRWDQGGKEAEIRVQPGTREVTVTKDGFAVFGERVELSDGKRRLLRARLEQEPRGERGPGGPPGATASTPEPAVQPRPAPTAGGPAIGEEKAAGTPADEGHRPGDVRDDNSLKMKFCWCPTRTTPGFWMGKYEVTQSEWAGLMGSMPLRVLNKGSGDQHPIYYVSHDDATEFCRQLTVRERNAGRLPPGWAYRLPTDAQWEYACRAGTTTATAFGDKLDSSQANFNGDWPHNGAPKGPNLGNAVQVGSYRPNAWGISDMHGNVGEFTDTPGRVHGGSWYDSGRNCCAEFSIPDTTDASDHVGFRVARVPSEDRTGHVKIEQDIDRAERRP